jgi:hypothetical protein
MIRFDLYRYTIELPFVVASEIHGIGLRFSTIRLMMRTITGGGAMLQSDRPEPAMPHYD